VKPGRGACLVLVGLFGCGLLVVGGLVVLSTLIMGHDEASGCLGQAGTSGVVTAAGGAEHLSRSQLNNAAAVISEGRRRGLPDQAVIIALAVANQESRFTNYANDGKGGDLKPEQLGIEQSLRLPHQAVGTDHGSLGVFQQQWPWWGTMQDLMNPTAAAGKFYGALMQLRGWIKMPLTVAAQRVQRSAYPSAYADDEQLARNLLDGWSPVTSVSGAAYTGAVASECAGSTDAGTVVFPLPKGSGYIDQHNWGHRAALWSHGHTGTDLSVGCGTPVLAATNGTVAIRTDQAWAGKWLVQVSTGVGQLTTWYAHMRAVDVANGKLISAGQQLGQVGDLGNATGCHLHFEVHPRGGSIYEDNVNPTEWLASHVGQQVPGDGGVIVPVSAHGSGSFRVSSFNVLGASHTARGGNEPWMDSGAARTKGIVQLIIKHDIDIAGLQEFQRSQWDAFRVRAGGSFGMYSPPNTRTDDTIIWRKDRFDVVQMASISIPYFNGHHLQMPYVLLRYKPDGRTFWLGDFHNPADTAQYHHQGKWRAQATRLEHSLSRRLRASGVPVLIVGDMNERHSYFCSMTADGGMHAAAGGGVGRPCHPPRKYNGIDWIFGSRDVNFGAHIVDDSPLVDRISDHPMVIATVD
jgi:murein DD-endopeptidase MepM/ murein hydrolase activator NlpD